MLLAGITSTQSLPNCFHLEVAQIPRQARNDKMLFVFYARTPKPVRLHVRTAVVDPTPELMKGLGKLFGREAVVLESEA